MTSSFNQFQLSPAVLRGVAKLGFDTPTPVQQHAIPLLLAGKDAIVQAKTGSGKTLAFGLPLLSMLKPGTKPQALVILPTRELALQVCESMSAVMAGGPLRLQPIYGGVGLGPQEKALARGVDVVVGTPGRLKDLLNRGSLDLSSVKVLVLDEADEMLDMGFRRDIEFLMSRLPARQQTLIFSATMPAAIEAIARQHLKEPAVVKLVAQEEVTPSTISHYFVKLEAEQRLDALIRLLDEEGPERAIIFTRMKHETKRLAAKLQSVAGIEAGFLNGNMSQNARNTMLARFKGGEFRYLIATDVAARGLDVEGLSHVIHYAVPTVVETYIHRSGRTGRAGNEGKTIIFVTPDAEADFKAIQKKISLAPFPLTLPPASANSATAEAEANAKPPRGQQQRRGQQPRQTEPAKGQAPKQERQNDRNGEKRQGRQPEREAARGTHNGRRDRQAPAGAWRKFKMGLPAGHRHTQERYHAWLVRTTGLNHDVFRSVTIASDHATFEVAGHAVAPMLKKLKTKA